MINFPTAPTVGQQFSASGRSWVWDGTVWVSNVPTFDAGPQGQAGERGPAGFRGGQGPQGFHGGPLPVQNGNRNRLLRAPSTTTLEWSNNVAGYIFNDPIISASGPRLRELDNTRFTFQINLNQGGVQKLRIINPSANIILPSPSVGKRLRVVIEQTNLGNHTINWSNVLWPNSVAPALNAETPVSTFDFLSDGQNWYGSKLRALPKQPVMRFINSSGYSNFISSAGGIRIPTGNYSNEDTVAVMLEYSSVTTVDDVPEGWTRVGILPDPINLNSPAISVCYKILEQSDSGKIISSVSGGRSRDMISVFRNNNGRILDVEVAGLTSMFNTGVQTITAPPNTSQKSCIAIHYATSDNPMWQWSGGYGSRITMSPESDLIRSPGSVISFTENRRFATQFKIFNPGTSAQNVTAGATLTTLPGQALFWLIIT